MDVTSVLVLLHVSVEKNTHYNPTLTRRVYNGLDFRDGAPKKHKTTD